MKKLIAFLMILLMIVKAIDIYAQNGKFIVAGKVVDKNNIELIGVHVKLEGKNNINAVTNENGEFVLEVPDGNGTLMFSYIGMANLKVPVKGRHSLNVTMEEDAIMLDEVVSIGYGTAKRSDLTGTVSSISGKDLEDIPVSTLQEALQGKIPGLVITSASGDLEASVQVRVRGGVSLTQDNSPLYIVDGFPLENALSMLDPSEIETIDVLKDASATAIYGSRGANGVIIIKTKSGKKNINTISYDMTMKATRAAGNVELLTPIEYLKFDYQRQKAQNLESWENRYGPIEDIYKNYGDEEGVDWQEEMLGQRTLSHKHTLNFTGGSERIQYNLSYIYDKIDGVMDRTGRNKHSIRLSLNNNLSSRISLGANVSYFLENTFSNGIYEENGSQMFNIFKYKPVLGIYEDEDGIYVDPDDPDAEAMPNNPHNMATSREQTSKRKNLSMNINANINIIEGLTYGLQLGYQNTGLAKKTFYNSISSQAIQSGGPFGTVNDQVGETLLGNHTLTYQKKMKRSKFDVVVGQEIKDYVYSQVEYGAHNFPEYNFGLEHIELGSSPDKFQSDKYRERAVSFFGRANYSFSRYLFTFTMRADGSSKFSNKNKWGYFPAGAFAWRLNEEPFIKKLGVFHNLKLRLSYGLTGNNQIQNYLFWSLMENSSMIVNNTSTTSYVPTIGNNDLKWETNKTGNIGLDVAFFNGRLAFTFDIYQTDTKDLLMDAKLQPSSGYTQSVRNIGATRNRGLEILMTSHNIKTKDFNWNTTLTLSFNKSVVKQLAGTDNWFINSKTNRNESSSYYDYVYSVGGQTGTYYGFIYDGLYQADEFTFENGVWTPKEGVVLCDLYSDGPQPGYAKYKNLNPDEDNVVTSEDRTKIGNANPICTGGLNNTFKYKDFSLSLFCTFKIGGKIYNGNIYDYLYPGNGSNTSKYVYDNMYCFLDDDGTRLIDTGNIERLMELNKGKIYPRVSSIPFSTLLLEDASYLRFSNINFTYNIPNKWLKKIFVKEALVGFSVQNLYTITKYTGYDPEVSMNRNNGLTPGIDKGSMPRNRDFTFNLKVRF